MPAAFPDRIAHAWPSTPEVGVINQDAADFETDWNDLFWRAGRGSQIFQTFNWNWHWSNHYLPSPSDEAAPSLAIVTGRRDGRLVMVWPLTTERVAGLSQLAWMGDPVSQYGDILVEPEAVPLLGEAWS